MAKETTPKETQPGDLIKTWLEQQTLETKLAACLLWALTDGDRGNPDLANDIYDGYEEELLAAAQDARAPISPETRTVLGCWIAEHMRYE